MTRIWYLLLTMHLFFVVVSYLAVFYCCFRTAQENRMCWRLKNRLTYRGMTSLNLLRQKRRTAGKYMLACSLIMFLYQSAFGLYLREIRVADYASLSLLLLTMVLSYSLMLKSSQSHNSIKFSAQVCALAALLSSSFL